MKNYAELIKDLYNAIVVLYPHYMMEKVYDGVNVYLENTPLYEVEFNREDIDKIVAIIDEAQDKKR